MFAVLVWNRRRWPVLTAVLLAAVTASSLAPLPALPLPDVAASDKLHHLVAYAALAFPAAAARPRRWVLVPPALLAWSGAIEVVQPYVNRVASPADLAANAAGLLLGMLLAAALRAAAGPGQPAR